MLRSANGNANEVNDEDVRLLSPSGGAKSYSLWKGSSLAKRLNVVGTITCVLDTAIHLASSRSSAVANFFSNTVPFYVSATYYILPSASLLGVYLKNLYSNGCSGDKRVDDEADKKAQQLVDEFYDVDGFSDYINTHPTARESLLNKIKFMQQNGYIDKIDLFINILYFSLRAMQGGLLILKAYDLASKETNDSITDWTDFASNIINAAYLMTMLIHNTCHKHKVSASQHILFSSGSGNITAQAPPISEQSSKFTV
jgi:hypothetical protein